MLNENDFAPGRGSFNHQQWLTGPSTNGRSSAFGALCLGSNPSGPARKTVVGRWLSHVGQTISGGGILTNDQRRILTTEDRRLTTTMATLATATEKKPGMSPEEKHERKPHR